MHKKIVFKASLVVVLFFGAAVIPSASLHEQSVCLTVENDGTLSGYVTDPSGNPIDGALIRVHFHGT